MLGFPMKQTFKRLLRWTARSVPGKVGRVVAEALFEHRPDWSLFQKAATRYGVLCVEVDGRYGRIQGDIRDTAVLGRYAETKVWAESTNEKVETFLGDRDGGTYLDIGANIGLTTIPIAQDPRVICHAFEPAPVNLRHFKRNVATNCQHGNVTLHEIALYDRSCTLELELSSDNMGDHRIRVKTESGSFFEQDRTTVAVRAERLDSVLEGDKLRRPLVVKSDTQGAEPAVFAGGGKILATSELLLFEYWPYGMKRLGLNPLTMFPFLLEHFHTGAVTPGDSETRGEFGPISNTIDTLHDLWNTEEPSYFDVIVSKVPF